MKLDDHLMLCKQTDDAHLPNFVAELKADDDLREQAGTSLASIDQSVLDRCWITRRHFDILTQALGA